MSEIHNAKLTGTSAVLLVKDIAAAANHYREAMGFEYPGIWVDNDYVLLKRDNYHLMLKQTANPDDVVPHWKVVENLCSAYFWCDDVDALHAEFVERGAKIDYGLCDQPYGVREFGIQDLDGHDVGFGQVTRG